MSNYNYDNCLRRSSIGYLPTGLKGVYTFDAACSGARGRAVR
jgi:hypothetical protein